jgi:hypothetical protein
MTDIEAKALALVNEVREERHYPLWMRISREYPAAFEIEALCRAIEQHEAFKQEVSDAAEMAVEAIVEWSDEIDKAEFLHQFIIPKPKPDPLEEVLLEIDRAIMWADICAEEIRAALDARGLEIREKGQ